MHIRQTFVLLLLLSTALPVVAASRSMDNDEFGAIDEVNGMSLYYRHAGSSDKPAIVMLHGFPSSSFMYRHALAGLADDAYIFAPDYPGFGNNSHITPTNYTYTFDSIAQTLADWLVQKGIDRYIMVMHDYGVPVGMRILSTQGDKLAGLVFLNGNLFEDGLPYFSWFPVRRLWSDSSPNQQEKFARRMFTEDKMRWQFTHGTQHKSQIEPKLWLQAANRLKTKAHQQAMINLLIDYQSNVEQYASWQALLEARNYPTSIFWGTEDALFKDSVAQRLHQLSTKSSLHLVDTGHFPLEEQSTLFIDTMKEFIQQTEGSQR